MKFYIEITLLSSIEIPIYFLWTKVYQQIHLALVENKNTNGKVSVGCAFPEYNSNCYNIGSKLRLFASTEIKLINLNLDKWFVRLKDYVHITSIRDVPKNIEYYGYYKRVQIKSSNSRLARRKSTRDGISHNEALSILSKREEKTSNLPFIQIKSLHSKQSFRLFIDFEKVTFNKEFYEFGSYGLSSKSPLPIF